MNFLAMLLQNAPDTSSAQQALLFMGPIMLIICVIVLAVILIPFWFICKKAGFSPWLSLINIIPLGNIILIYILAFAEWKVAPVPPAQFGYPYPPPPPPPQV
jgi:hypothetical protein